MPLERSKQGEYLRNLENMCLKKLQKLVFSLYNYCDDNRFRSTHYSCDFTPPYHHIIPPLYKNVSCYYLSEAKLLKSLYISKDRSRKTFKIIETIADSLPCLNDVTLLAVDTSHNVWNDGKCFETPIECEITQEMIDSDPDYRMPSSSNTLNHLLARLLKNKAIKSLQVLSLHARQNWGEHAYFRRFFTVQYYDRYALEIQSNSLQHLRIEQYDFCDITLIDCPELVSIKLVDFCEDIPESNCLQHADMLINGYESLLEGCPRIEHMNKVDIKSLQKKVGEDNEWANVLDEVCPCTDEVRRWYALHGR